MTFSNNKETVLVGARSVLIPITKYEDSDAIGGQMINIKRTADNRLYDVICTNILASGETITGTPTVTCDEGSLVFPTAAVVNTAPINYPSLNPPITSPIGTVIQIRISGGSIPVMTNSLDCVVRVLFTTTISPNQIEATFILRLQDSPNFGD